MTRIRALAEQPAVTKQGDIFTICLNGKRCSQTLEDGTVEKYWEYDWNEFKDPSLTLAEVQSSPAYYLNYETPREETLKKVSEKDLPTVVAELKAQLAITEQAMQELILAQLGG